MVYNRPFLSARLVRYVLDVRPHKRTKKVRDWYNEVIDRYWSQAGKWYGH
jgi:hypothetical protein